MIMDMINNVFFDFSWVIIIFYFVDMEDEFDIFFEKLVKEGIVMMGLEVVEVF